MLPISQALGEFLPYVRFFVGVPFFGDAGRPTFHITVLVEPWTSSLIRRQMRRALVTAFNADAFRDAANGGLVPELFATGTPQLKVHIKNDRTLL